MNYFTKRVIALQIDIAISTIIGLLVSLVLLVFLTEKESLRIGFYISFGIFMCKDFLINKKSLGKEKMGLRLEIKNKIIPFLIIRNIPLLIWPLEGILVFLFKKQLGDFISSSMVVEKDYPDINRSPNQPPLSIHR